MAIVVAVHQPRPRIVSVSNIFGGIEAPSLLVCDILRFHLRDIERFLKLVKVVPCPRPDRAQGHCWEWKGYVCKKGYGRFTYAGVVSRLPHRVGFLFANGYQPAEHAAHLCNNKRCVNPGHIEAQTAVVNIAEMNDRRRFGACIGQLDLFRPENPASAIQIVSLFEQSI